MTEVYALYPGVRCPPHVMLALILVKMVDSLAEVGAGKGREWEGCVRGHPYEWAKARLDVCASIHTFAHPLRARYSLSH